MNRFNNITSMIVAGVLIPVMVIVIVCIRACQPAPEVKASLSDVEVAVGESFVFADSTRNAEAWLWEFGDEKMSEERKGVYAYRHAGRYKIRLTVNGKYEKLFIVNVKEADDGKLSRLVEIDAPSTAMQGEYVVFNGIGNDRQWQWEFGESGIVDAREKSPLYAYAKPGNYQVRLRTENTQYPVVHRIEVRPGYSTNDSTDVMSVIGADIREKLQAISDGKPFNTHYRYIIRKYMCGDEKTEVVINNNKYNDIYSYCQGLAATGRGRKTVIEHVAVEIPDLESGCVSKVIVIQASEQN